MMDKYDKEFEKLCKKKKRRGCPKYSQIGKDMACCNCERVWLEFQLQQKDKQIDGISKLIENMFEDYKVEILKWHDKKRKPKWMIEYIGAISIFKNKLQSQIKALQE